MNIRLFRYPAAARLLYRDAIYRVHGPGEKVYITFDDGPSQGSPEIIDVLKRNEVEQAVFFCLGVNIQSHPEETIMIRKNGYSLANHGYYHINGWRSTGQEYTDNCLKGAELTGSLFFRPPYGLMTSARYSDISKIARIVLWDLLLYDWDMALDSNYILRKAERLIRPGAVIVLHDKENRCALRVLEGLIRIIRMRGYEFGDLTIDSSLPQSDG
ncbi:MAG: polysaccharide deacetylase family protein [Bacteroidales bacterium]|nr:polysaccharide deacetylase family protein [Bacteroidales bacterium]